VAQTDTRVGEKERERERQREREMRWNLVDSANPNGIGGDACREQPTPHSLSHWDLALLLHSHSPPLKLLHIRELHHPKMSTFKFTLQILVHLHLKTTLIFLHHKTTLIILHHKTTLVILHLIATLHYYYQILQQYME